ncbi:beta-ketoacyl synthase N-terminal-like domain-containing protein [Bacillus horti]|uniref:Acyl-CoA synthetase (AMP-forming)/AMP-acid ligase II/3-oxoacyl-(Acyl-carrier-protein) synthase n=1 Tax=Caldalkalibacillus horti TaxID=77523 RepID=A0ABT9VUS6_9BACI|nr:beta-ketoacyl synthase N-terminal-like domain-containing protein [Bacillus horti]MDQ0164746.1 acyl-CoA synthetase (AMP-forming)/AMP-acid ligase II/3-oxoacyl-(acyl-carrier-protein) synthase [Bacillus horti]
MTVSVKAIQHGRPITLPNEYSSLAEMIMYIAEKHPHKGMTYIDGSGNESFESYPELVEEARKYLKELNQLGVNAGDIAILIIDQPKEFYRAFWACILGGIIAAPISQPTSWEVNSPGLLKFTKVWELLEQPVIIIEEQFRDRYKQLQGDALFRELNFISTEDLKQEEMADIYFTKPDDLVFLQFSSGSTGIPKGVKLTNKNIILNNLSCAIGMEIKEEDYAFTWLPHTHDMGLFGQHLSPIIMGSSIVVFSPYTFVRSPYLFLKKISEYRGTWFCSTNFGYDWMVRKVPDDKLSTLDLSSLRFTLNGAEPISIHVLQSFVEKFSKCGYKKTMMLPAYGMAEATVGVALPKIGSLPRVEHISHSKLVNERVAVSIGKEEQADIIEYAHEGYAMSGVSIRIADDQGNTLDEQMIGEIQIQGPSVTTGYYNRDELNEDLFIDGWLRTGDLGFMVDGSLVVSGRIKDVIFIRGQNYFAHDLEEVLYNEDSLQRGNLAIAGLFNSKTQQEEILVFLKHKGDLSKLYPLRKMIIDKLQESLGIQITHVIPIRMIPKTTSGKLQRFLLRSHYENGEYDSLLDEINKGLEENKKEVLTTQHSKNDLESFLLQSWSELLDRPLESISIDDEFLALGGNSIKAYQLLDRIDHYLDREVGTEALVLCKSIRQFTAYLDALPETRVASKAATNRTASTTINTTINTTTKTASGTKQLAKDMNAVAITGLSVRLPQAKNKQEFWENLCSKRDSISKISTKRKQLAGKNDWDEWIGELEDVDQFDNDFFDIPMDEAVFMDPQQRLVLEISYEALEEAGMIPGLEEKRNIGVYGGISSNTYYQLLLERLKNGDINDVHQRAMVGNMHNIICAQVSHFYNFTGPSLAIDTACSSYLVALHHAVKAIRQGGVEGAIVVGTNIMATPTVHALSRRSGIVSSTRRTKVFDEDADGSVLGEGIIVAYLEPLHKAVQEKKNILGIVRGTAVNNDGYSLGIMAPNPKGQLQVLSDAYSDAGFSPDEISYIEAHGSGTAIGDPIEVNALSKIFSESAKANKQSIGIGSVKTNIGHLLPAAGGASLAKVLLCFKNKRLVPSLHAEKINPALELEKTPFYIVQDVKNWSVDKENTRKAGISSFGLGGTNVHVVLEEWKEEEQWEQVDHTISPDGHLLTLSAKSAKALDRLIQQTEEMIMGLSATDIHHLCFTRNRYRNHMGYRAACIISKNEHGLTVKPFKKGQFLKNRKAKISLIIGDVKGYLRESEDIHLRETRTVLNPFFQQMVDIANEQQISKSSAFSMNHLYYFSYWYSVLKTLKQYENNRFEIKGVQTGCILSDLLNGSIDEREALKLYFGDIDEMEKESKLGDDIDSNKADIVIYLFSQSNSILNDEELQGKKIIRPELDDNLPFGLKLLSIMSELYVAGADFDWSMLYPDGSGKLIELPGYPFDQKSYWMI